MRTHKGFAGEAPPEREAKRLYRGDFSHALMAREFFTMDDFDLAGRTVLLRVDINSPVDPATGELLNDARIREHLTTIRARSRAELASTRAGRSAREVRRNGP